MRLYKGGGNLVYNTGRSSGPFGMQRDGGSTEGARNVCRCDYDASWQMVLVTPTVEPELCVGYARICQ